MTNIDALQREMDEYLREAHAILDRSNGDLSPADSARYDELKPLIEERRAAIAQHSRDLANIRSATRSNDYGSFATGASGGGSYQRSSDRVGATQDPWDTSDLESRAAFGHDRSSIGKELRERARDAIERMPHATDKVREAATQFVDRDDPAKGNAVSNLVLATSSERYCDAFVQLIRSKGNMAILPAADQEIMARAMSLTDTAGGFVVPFQLDPTIILTANGSANQVRQIARVVQATGDVWHGVSSAGISGSWDGEAEEVSDDSPTVEQPGIPVHKYQAFIELTHELQMDAPTLANDISRLIAFDKDAKESIAHVTGSGSGQPTGIITALTGGSSVVPSGTTDTLAVSDVYELDGALPQRYAANGSWLAHRRIYNKIRQLDTAGGNALWGQLGEGRKSELLGRPDYISEAMDQAVNLTQDNLVLLFGDFQNYVVVDRLGTTMSYIPHLFGSNGRPTGKAGWHAWFRGGGDSVNDGAFRLLNVT
ncbi:phage major capsid protein [Mycolicibacterium sp. Y3]